MPNRSVIIENVMILSNKVAEMEKEVSILKDSYVKF